MGFLSTLFSVVKEVVPVAWDGFVSPIGNWLSETLKGMDTVAMIPNPLVGGAINAETVSGQYSMDAPIDDKERKQEEVLVVTQQDVSRRQLIAFANNQQRIERLGFQMPVTGLSKSKVVLTLHCEYTYSSQPTNLDIKNINYNDHVVIQMIPKNFSFYKNLLKHELFKFSNMRIVSANTSGFDTTTVIGFIPVTTDTDPYTNGLLMQLCKKLEVTTGEEVSYNIRFCSPDVITYEKRENGSLKNIKSKYMFLEPNKIIKSDYVAALPEGTDLSYGSVVIIKQNVGSIVGMSFNINMEFDVWDYIINGVKLSEVKDKDLDGKDDEGDGDQSEDDGQGGDGDGSGSGSAAPKGRVGRRNFKK